MEAVTSRPPSPSSLSSGQHCRKVRLILEALYGTVQTLQSYLMGLQSGRPFRAAIVSTHDKPGYTRLLRSTLVCAEKGAVLPPSVEHQDHCCHQSEIILKAIERIQKREGLGKNLLTLGFNTLSDDGDAQVSSSHNVESRYPNQNSSILLRPAWRTLLSRAGDEIMLHLLESRAIYVGVPPSCYVQVTGTPVYLLWPWTGGPTIPTEPIRHPPAGRKKALYNTLRARIKRYRQIQRKKNRIKKKELTNKRQGSCHRGQDSLSPGKSSVTSVKLCVKCPGKWVRKAVKENVRTHAIPCSSDRSRQGSVGSVSLNDCMEQKETHTDALPQESWSTSHGARGNKREASDCLEHQDKKRARTSERDGQVMGSTNETSQRDGQVMGTSDTTSQRDGQVVGSMVKRQVHASTSSVTSGSTRMIQHIAHRGTGEQSQSDRQELLKKVRKKKHKDKQKDRTHHRKYKFHHPVHKRHVLYSKYLTECFLKSHILAKVNADDDGIKRLLVDIFLDNNVSIEPWLSCHVDRPNANTEANLTPATTLPGHHDVMDPNRTPPVTHRTSEKAPVTAATPVGHHVQLQHVKVSNPLRPDGVGTSKNQEEHGNDEQKASSTLAIETLMSDVPGLSPILKKFINNHRRCNYRALLDKFCPCQPMPPVVKDPQNEDTKSKPKDPVPNLHAPVYARGRLKGNRSKPSNSITCKSGNSMICTPRGQVLANLPLSSAASGCTTCRTTEVMPNQTSDTGSKRTHTRVSLPWQHQLKPDVVEIIKDHRIAEGASQHSTLEHCPTRTRSLRQASVEPGVRQSPLWTHYCKEAHTVAMDTACTSSDRAIMTDGTSAAQHPLVATVRHLVDDNVTHARKECGGSPLDATDSRRCDVSIAELLENHTPINQVLAWLHHVCEENIPVELVGCKHNMKQFMKTVSRFVMLGKFEKVTLGYMMMGTKVKVVKWSSPLSIHADREVALASVLHWLLAQYVLNILKAYFYVTDTAIFRNRVFFYRKKVWAVVQLQAVRVSRAKGHLKPLEKKEGEDSCRQGALGVCPLRFLPKQSDVRPILNLSSTPSGGNMRSSLSVNKKLTNLFHVLSFLTRKMPTLIGASKPGLDVYSSIQHLRKSGINARRPWYFVKVDLAGCYDSINQNLLMEIIRDILTSIPGEFLVRRYARVVLDNERLRRTFHRDVKTLTDFEPDFLNFTQSQQKDRGLHDAILVDQVVHQVETVETLLEKLTSHVTCNTVKIGSTHYHQVAGISQGSVLSSILCALYYGRMEEECLPRSQHGELLMRQVDDFLFVTRDHQRALNFLNIMREGIPKFNCRINEMKTLTNVCLPATSLIPQLRESVMFPWCGLLINTLTLEVSADYSRYIGLRAADTLSFDLHHNPGQTLKGKILGSLKSKCQPVLMDGTLNTMETVMVNLFQLLLLTAYKFISCEQKLPPKQRVANNLPFFLGIIVGIPATILQMTTRKPRQSMSFPLSKHQVSWFMLLKGSRSRPLLSRISKWHHKVDPTVSPVSKIEKLNLEAFHTVLTRRASVYQPLLVALRTERRHLCLRVDSATLTAMMEVTQKVPTDLGFVN